MTNFETLSSISLSESPVTGQSARCTLLLLSRSGGAHLTMIWTIPCHNLLHVSSRDPHISRAHTVSGPHLGFYACCFPNQDGNVWVVLLHRWVGALEE